MFISYVLRYGVLLCAAVIAFGLIFKLVISKGAVANSDAHLLSQLLNGKWIAPDNVSTLIGSTDFFAHATPNKIVNLGVVLLIALPIVRVGMTIFLFLFERDWIYVVITAIVFATLLSSVFMKLMV
jgi:uncharacterized membrane protein